MDDRLHVEDHLGGIAVLALLAIDEAADAGVQRIELAPRHDPGAERARPVQRLALEPLAVTALQLTPGDVIANGPTPDVVERLLWRDIGCLLYTSPSPRDGLLSRMPSSA